MAGAKVRNGRVILVHTRTGASPGRQTRVVTVGAGFPEVAADSAVVVGEAGGAGARAHSKGFDPAYLPYCMK